MSACGSSCGGAMPWRESSSWGCTGRSVVRDRCRRRTSMPDWNPWEERPLLESICVGGVELRPGDRVRLWPRGRADIMDLALEGKIATLAAIEQDLEGRVYLAVVVEDDPGRDLGE